MKNITIKWLSACALVVLFFSQLLTASAQGKMMHWENQPESFHVDANYITMRTNAEKYLWGDNHQFDYDFPYSHFYYQDISSDFTAEVTLVLDDEHNFGNQGILIKITPEKWIKLYLGREYQNFSLNTLYATDHLNMDYSSMPIQLHESRLWLRASYKEGILYLSYSGDNMTYHIVRIINMSKKNIYWHVGFMADSPMSIGFEALFENFSIKAM